MDALRVAESWTERIRRRIGIFRVKPLHLDVVAACERLLRD